MPRRVPSPLGRPTIRPVTLGEDQVFGTRLQKEDRSALLSAALLWIFGYGLATGLILLSRGVGGWPSMIAEIPVFAIATVGAASLYTVMRAMRSAPFAVRLLAAGILVATSAAALAAINVAIASWATALATAIGEEGVRLGSNAFSSRFLGYFWAFSLNASIFWGHIATARVRAQAVALAEAEKAAMQAQLAALRFQLNPHFLFNSLNALSSLLMQAGARDADAMLARLCDFLRASLVADPNALIALEEELETAQAYLEIEGIRFGDRLIVEFDCGPDVRDALIPNFLLQPLVENAVKHAVSPAKSPVVITISARRDGENVRITVDDNGDAEGVIEKRPGGGLGLRNVRDRLHAAFGDRGGLTAARGSQGFRSEVILPFSSAGTRGRDA